MTNDEGKIMLTGGEGRLGGELSGLLDGLDAPTLAEMDVTHPEQIRAALEHYRPDVLVHAAAYTDVVGAERDRRACWQVNVEGTRNIVSAIAGRELFLVYISTDYAFYGAEGGYRENDPVGPVRNYYALSKLVGEEIVRLSPRHLVIRTSFRPREWPYEKAFTDVYTSQDYVDIIAPEISMAIRRCRQIPYDTLHIATERKSAFELAKRRRSDVTPATKQEAGVELPDDVSLNVSRWEEMKAQWTDQ